MIFNVDPEWGIVTTSFTKAYGLGGLKLGIAVTKKELVDEIYRDVLNTVGNSSNITQIVAAHLLAKGKPDLEAHMKKWEPLKKQAEEWLEEKKLEFFPSKVGITYWVKLPIRDTYKWTTQCTIPQFNLAAVPGTFFLFKNDYSLARTNTIRLSLGSMNPSGRTLKEALSVLEKAIYS
jgi:aspartate/methionine/tyrosine aminotransferase